MTRPTRALLPRRDVLALLGAGLLVAACAPKVYAERTPDFALESVKTYAWITEDLVLIQFGQDQPNIRTKDNELRVRAAIDRELAARGFTKVSREEAEVLVAFSVGVEKRPRLEGGDGSAITTNGPSNAQTKGRLNIHIVEPTEFNEVWHGWTSKWLAKGSEPDAVVNEAVSRIMATYPGSAP